MRHLWSLLAGLVAAPLAWLLLAAGQHRSQEIVDGWTAAGSFETADLIGPGLFLLGAGVVLGLLGTLRWSPVGPLVAGVLFLTPAALMFIDPLWTLNRVDAEWVLVGQDLAPRVPAANGTLLVLGALLLMAVFSSRRWQLWPGTEAATVAGDGDEPDAEVPGEAGADGSADGSDENSPEPAKAQTSA